MVGEEKEEDQEVLSRSHSSQSQELNVFQANISQ